MTNTTTDSNTPHVDGTCDACGQDGLRCDTRAGEVIHDGVCVSAVDADDVLITSLNGQRLLCIDCADDELEAR